MFCSNLLILAPYSSAKRKIKRFHWNIGMVPFYPTRLCHIPEHVITLCNALSTCIPHNSIESSLLGCYILSTGYILSTRYILSTGYILATGYILTTGYILATGKQLLTFRRIVVSQSSGSGSPRLPWIAWMLDTEDKGITILRKVDKYLLADTL